MEEEMGKQSSLFPLFPQPPDSTSAAASLTIPNTTPRWLSNPSFTADLAAINDAVSSRHATPQIQPEEEEEAEEEEEEVAAGRPQYKLVESSGGDDSDHTNKKRKHKKRKSQSARYAYHYAAPSSRKPDVRSWSDTTTTKDYFFDSRGDRDNLAFGCIYRMDIARYKHYKSSKLGYFPNFHRKQGSWGLEGDNDINALDAKLKSAGRYWSAKYAALERHKNFKRIRIVATERPASMNVSADFIPVSGDQMSASVEESWEDEVLRRTREFNRLTRERPHDEKAWLDFVEFQDKVATMQPQKGARLQTLEKKISVLEKAAELNPENEQLLLALMSAYQSRDSTDVLIGRWEKILTQNSGSYKLWRQFLHVVQGEFSRFKVSELRKIYATATRALSTACSMQYRQVPQSSLDPSIVQLELSLVDIFIGLCRFEWLAGYQELATALFQAEIEYGLFCPSLLLTEQSKRRLFEYFWNSNGARVGEDGALGWSTWLEKDEEHRQMVIDEESSHSEEGGWTGWSKPLYTSNDVGVDPETVLDNNASVEELDDESETRDYESRDDTEALLKMLGISGDIEANGEGSNTTSWTRWSEEELSRDSVQWMPCRAKSGIPHSNGIEDREDDEQLLRVILFEDVNEYLFSISSEEARLSLIFQFIDFYGGRICQWASSNSSSWAEKTLGLEALPDSILEDLRRVHDVLTKTESRSGGLSLDVILGSRDDISVRTSMMKFLRNAALLFLTIIPHNYILEEAALVAEELSNTRMSSCSYSVTPCRALAKRLLKSNRQDVLLCGVYARREAFFGNIDHARKVFDMALSSIEGLSPDIQSNASLLFFWYAEVELADTSGTSSEASSRAMHILSCLGSGVKYSPFRCHPSSVQQLKARQGFKERIRVLMARWAHGIKDDHSIALICSAALFEELTTGWDSGIDVLKQAFSMVLPEERSQSYQLEFLFNYYLRMLWKHRAQSKFSKVWDSIVQGLQLYPSSPELYVAFMEISHLHATTNKLRWILDDHCHKKPSVIVWLFALSFEISRGGSHHRICGLFERALGNDRLRNSVILWRWYIAYEMNVACNPSAAKRIYFRAIHACPWSKRLWLDGFLKLNSVLTAKELSDLQEVMRDKELNLRTDIYEILLQDDIES